MSEQKSIQSLCDENSINPRYDTTDSYGRNNSYYGNGKHPPDWDKRRAAVWDRQKYWCGRCQVYKGDVEHNACHHVQPLSQGGSNHLDNLVGLCGDCHSIMPPDTADANGNAAAADILPDSNSDPRVATVRKGGSSAELEHDLQALSHETHQPNQNGWSARASSACYNIPVSHARNLETNNYLASTLKDHGIVPRTEEHNQVHVNTTFTGLTGPFTRATPKVYSHWTSRRDEHIVSQTESTRDGYGSVLTTTPDPSLEGRVGVKSTHNDVPLDPTVRESISFSTNERTKAVELSVPAPPFNRDTAIDYLRGFFSQFLKKFLIVFVVMAALIALTPVSDSPLMIFIVALLTVTWIGIDVFRSASKSPGVTVSALER